MDNYRRPAPAKTDAHKAMVDGFIATKTKTTNPKVQPYRHAVISAAEQRSMPDRQRAVRQRALRQQRQVAAQAKPVNNDRPRRRMRPLDMSLPNGEGFNRHHMTPVIRRRVRAARTWIFRGVLANMALVIVAGGVLAGQGFFNAKKVFKGTAQSAASLQNDVNPNLLKGEGDGRINVLLVGIGGQGHSGGDLTDTIILASIDPINSSASLLSVPRDLWVTVPGKGSMKINATYALTKYAYMKKNKVDANNGDAINAGFVALNETLERVLGVPIHYNALLNFQAFRQAIDTVGGITVDVPTDLYDPSMAWENKKDPYLARAGIQNFDGKQALIYVRSRETSSDFARSERQRAVMLALKQKTVSLGVLANPTKIAGLLSAFGSNVQTDLSLSDASRLYTIIKRIQNNKIQSISLAGTTSTTSSAAGTDSLVTTGNINGQSIVMPKAGLENYAAIQDYVRGQLKDGYIVKEQARVAVYNGTVQKDLGEKVAQKLRSYGYNVTQVGRASSGSFPSTVVVNVSGNKKKYTKHYLEQRFNTTAVGAVPDSTIPTKNVDFVVVLGGDEVL